VPLGEKIRAAVGIPSVGAGHEDCARTGGKKGRPSGSGWGKGRAQLDEGTEEKGNPVRAFKYGHEDRGERGKEGRRGNSRSRGRGGEPRRTGANNLPHISRAGEKGDSGGEQRDYEKGHWEGKRKELTGLVQPGLKCLLSGAFRREKPVDTEEHPPRRKKSWERERGRP